MSLNLLVAIEMDFPFSQVCRWKSRILHLPLMRILLNEPPNPPARRHRKPFQNMTNSDWPQDDHIASMEPSSDLFDGDILGDELIDIYNAAVVGGGDDDAMNGM